MRKDLLGLYPLTAEEIGRILKLGAEIRQRLARGEKEFGALKGRSAVTLFYENSTRTRTSFELAAKFAGATVESISIATSSVQKGETLIDTGKTLDAMKNDFFIIRHPMAGAPQLLAETVRGHVINAGDGMHEHPTQALLDLLTATGEFGSLAGRKVAILGDISHSRVARSDLIGFTKLGAEVHLFAPATLMPCGLERLGAKLCSSREEAVKGADIVIGLRIQLERQRSGNFPSLGEYAKFYGIDENLMRLAAPHAIVMHPGPVNRGVELTCGVIDGASSRIEAQVLSGLAVRIAVLILLDRGEL